MHGMIVSRLALVLALIAVGYLMTCAADVPCPSSNRSTETAADLAQLASQPTRPAPRPEKRSQPAQRVIVPNDSPLRLVAYDAPQAVATLRSESPNPFQLISPEITAKTELIPGRWKARHRLTTEVFGDQSGEPDSWISELRAPQLDWRAESLEARREEADSRRHGSARR